MNNEMMNAVANAYLMNAVVHMTAYILLAAMFASLGSLSFELVRFVQVSRKTKRDAQE